MQVYILRRLNILLNGILSGDYQWNDNSITTTCEKIGYQVNGRIRYRTTSDLINEAILLKRNGDYSQSLENYLDVIEGTLSTVQKVPAEVVWPMCKVLVAANQYLYAFLLLNSCEDALMPYYTFFNDDEKYTLKNIHVFLILQDRFVDEIKSNHFENLMYLTQQQSGNPQYSFVQTKTMIKKQYDVISTIYNTARKYNVN